MLLFINGRYIEVTAIKTPGFKQSRHIHQIIPIVELVLKFILLKFLKG